MKKVFIHFYSKTNLGDDLFVKILTSRYKDEFIAIATRNSGFLSTIRNLRVYKKSLFFLVTKILEKLLGERNIWLKRLVGRCDAMVYVGGSIFIENNNLQHWQREREFYQTLHAPYFILGSNIGPYQHEDFLPIVRDIFRGAEDVCLRDEASYELVKNMPNVRVATDIAFSLEVPPHDAESADRTAVFSLIDGTKKFDDETTQKYEQEIRVMTERLLDTGYRVVYMSFCRHEGDEDANARVRNGLSEDLKQKVVEFNYDGDIDAALSVLASSEIIIGSRFHANILGLVYGKKVLPMAYSDKTTDILKDMEFPGQIIDIRQIKSFDGNVIDFNAIPTMDIDSQRSLAEVQFRELDKVLTKRV